MSGIFRNLSNSGVARFVNLSNSGRGIFYGPGSPINPGTTTTSTTTTTTTGGETTTTSTTTTTTTSPQVRIDWNLSEEGSGAVRLVIRNSSNIAILDEESVGVTPVGGTIYLNESDTPYSATVSVATGTEVAQYRICNNTDSTEIVLNTNVPVSSTYTVSPTPTWSTIYATYGNTNTPINCPV